MNFVSMIEKRNKGIEETMAAWTIEEHLATLRELRSWKRSHVAFGAIFILIGLFNLEMAMASWVLLFALVQGILYVATSYAYRIIELRQLIGPITWLVRYSLKDLATL